MQTASWNKHTELQGLSSEVFEAPHMKMHYKDNPFRHHKAKHAHELTSQIDQLIQGLSPAIFKGPSMKIPYKVNPFRERPHAYTLLHQLQDSEQFLFHLSHRLFTKAPPMATPYRKNPFRSRTPRKCKLYQEKDVQDTPHFLKKIEPSVFSFESSVGISAIPTYKPNPFRTRKAKPVPRRGDVQEKPFFPLAISPQVFEGKEIEHYKKNPLRVRKHVRIGHHHTPTGKALDPARESFVYRAVSPAIYDAPPLHQRYPANPFRTRLLPTVWPKPNIQDTPYFLRKIAADVFLGGHSMPRQYPANPLRTRFPRVMKSIPGEVQDTYYFPRVLSATALFGSACPLHGPYPPNPLKAQPQGYLRIYTPYVATKSPIPGCMFGRLSPALFDVPAHPFAYKPWSGRKWTPCRLDSSRPDTIDTPYCMLAISPTVCAAPPMQGPYPANPLRRTPSK